MCLTAREKKIGEVIPDSRGWPDGLELPAEAAGRRPVAEADREVVRSEVVARFSVPAARPGGAPVVGPPGEGRRDSG
jgi:hypothetical protein